MEKFSTEFHRKFDQEDLGKIEASIERLYADKIGSIDVRTLSPVAKMPSKIHDLLQIGLRRMIELADGAIREMNRENPTNTFVLVRAAMETGALLFDASRQVKKALDAGTNAAFDECDKYLMDVLLGSKSKSFAQSEEFQARNVLTIVQRLTKELGVPLMEFYETLSEHAHPNYLGMMGIYQHPARVGDVVVKFVDGPTEARDSVMRATATGGLAIALDMMEMALSDYRGLAVAFAVACEKQIYEEGNWPRGDDYPIKR